MIVERRDDDALGHELNHHVLHLFVEEPQIRNHAGQCIGIGEAGIVVRRCGTRQRTGLVRQMIDNYLIETQIADTPGIDVSEAEVDAELQNVPAGAGAPSKAVREAVRQRIRMRKYLEVRFGQYIRPSDEDIRKYYNDVFVPAAKEKGLNPTPPLEQVTDLIRTNVRQEGLNHELNIWLEAFHRRSNIEVFE